jgi:hypothetical protein
MVTVSVAVCPIMDSSSSSLTSCEITYDEEVEEQLSPDVRDAVENGVNSSYLQGNDITPTRLWKKELDQIMEEDIFDESCTVVAPILILNKCIMCSLSQVRCLVTRSRACPL